MTTERIIQLHGEHGSNLVQRCQVGQDKLELLAYVPDYIGETQEAALLQHIRASRSGWTQLSGRRLQSHGGVVHPKGLLQAPLPTWLQPLLQQLHSDTAVYGEQPPNHVLINAYRAGKGITPHEDGPAYWPGVCILSLAAPAVIRFWRKDGPTGLASVQGPPQASLLLQPRSLLVFAGDAYSHCLHGIHPVEEEELDPSCVNLASCSGIGPGTASVARSGERVSLTVRRVARVVKNIVRLGAR